MVVCGREFTLKLIARIQARVDAGGEDLTRAALSREVCEWLDWRDPRGRLQEMSCRVGLLRLEASGHVALPQSRWCARPLPERRRGDGRQRQAQVQCDLSDLGRIRVVEVCAPKTPELSTLWNDLIGAHHYLGYVPAVGRQKRYLLESERYGHVAAAAFSAAAWRCAPREKWIGWSDCARRDHLQEVVCNSRFLILPWIEVKNLASHALARLASRVVEDWQETYGYAPVLLETYVLGERFKGISYNAAGWLHVGQTAGYSRDERSGHAAVEVKEVYLHPLRSDARERLRDGAAPAGKSLPAGADWAWEEFGGAELGDQRLVQRLVEVGRDFYARPQAHIPQAVQGRARVKAAYRLLDHPELHMKEFLSGHVAATVERAKQESVVLAVQDTTSLNYTGIKDICKGLGSVGTYQSKAVGLIVHDTVVFTPAGLPLGVLGAQVWARKPRAKTSKAQKKAQRRSIKEKESEKWLKSYAAACRLAIECGKPTTVVSVGDREADLYELFAEARDRDHGNRGAHLLVRASQNRRVQQECGYLFDHLYGLDAAGQYELTVTARPGRAARVATMSVRFAKVTLKAPKGKAALGSIDVCAVLASEERALPGSEKALEWLLLTTLAVSTVEQARQKIDWYSVRWGIEIFHRTLKSGCRMEDRQLENASRLENCLAIDMVVAWRILHLRHLQRVDPEAPCTVYFEPHQWEALYAVTHPGRAIPAKPINIRTATRLVAMLGGFQGRKGDGEPGAETLWRGIQMLDAICIGWIAARRAFARGP